MRSKVSIKDLYQLFISSEGISTDTRKIKANTLFFALKGPNFNGNLFAKQALESGASFAIIDEENPYLDSRLLLVEDVLETLQGLANYHRKYFTTPFIGIAGSNGKTTTKELTYAVLSKKYKTFATKGNLNNHIGVPLTILSIPIDTEMAIIELGANHIGELAFLCKICEPTHGLVTNIGLDHLEGYGSLEGVAQGNSELFSFLKETKGTIFINSLDHTLMGLTPNSENMIPYGNKKDTFWSKNISDSLFLNLETSDGIKISSNLIGNYNQDNINAALCIGKHFRVSSRSSGQAIEEYQPSNNRSQLIKKGTNAIILDCYNANPSSMSTSIESLNTAPGSNKVYILGDMFELGLYSEKEHQNIVDLLITLNMQNAYLCGLEFSKTKIIGDHIRAFKDQELLRAYLTQNKIEYSTILIKGSRGMAMEQIVHVL